MKKLFGHYKGWDLIIIPQWSNHRTAFFIIGPGPDPKMLFGERVTHDEALVAARKAIVFEARNESSSRGNR